MTGYLQTDDSTRRTQAVTLQSLLDLRSAGKKITVLTAYDSSFAALMDRCGVDVLLVGDSLGNVVQGQSTTLPVTLEHMAYHTTNMPSSSPTCRSGLMRRRRRLTAMR